MRRLTGVLLGGVLWTLIKHDPTWIFAVVFLEELGVPLPVPGDVFIIGVGVLVSRGQTTAALAAVAIVLGAVLGAGTLFTLSRRFGAPFLERYARYLHLSPEDLHGAEQVFGRWGLWVVILGRHVPGMRVVLSAIAGLLRFDMRLFAAAVTISSTAWALLFLWLGIHFGRQLRPLMHIPPAHLIPWIVFGLIALTAMGYVLRQRLYERGRWAIAAALGLGRGNDPR